MKSKHSYLMILVLIAAIFVLKSMSFLYLPTIISMLFMNDEKGIRATSFAPVNKKSSVYGRYMFVLLSFVLCLAVNLTADLVVPHFYAAYTSGGVFFYILMSVLFFALVSIELPLMYWKGYAKEQDSSVCDPLWSYFSHRKSRQERRTAGLLSEFAYEPSIYPVFDCRSNPTAAMLAADIGENLHPKRPLNSTGADIDLTKLAPSRLHGLHTARQELR